MLSMGFRESLSCGFGEQQLYYESPVNSHPAHRRFGEGIDVAANYGSSNPVVELWRSQVESLELVNDAERRSY
jgi:hypothetical protein